MTTSVEPQRPVPNIDVVSWGNLRDALACLSLANIAYARVWEELLLYRHSDTYFMDQLPGRQDYVSVMTCVLVVAGLMMLFVRLCRSRLSPKAFRAVRFGVFALALVPLNSLRAIFASSNAQYLKSPVLQVLHGRVLVLLVPVVLACIWFAWQIQRFLVKFAIALLICLTPFWLITFTQAIAAVLHTPPQLHDNPPAPRLANARTSPRVLWVIFDEWDYRLTFQDRPAGLALPEIDRFRNEALSARRAVSPAMDTGTSLPTLLTGRRLRMLSYGTKAPPSFSVQDPEGLDRVPWRKLDTVFSVARQDGFNTGLVGWYLPYCRMLDTVLTECAWWPMPTQATSTGDTYGQKLIGQTRSLLETDSLSPFGQSLATQQKVRLYEAAMEASKRQIDDPGLGLVFLHLPVPHAPHAYDRRTGRFDLKNKPLSGYVDSLALADRTLGEFRREMEAHGTWDRTTVIISADHPFRVATAIDGKPSFLVPFLIRFPKDPHAATFEPRFNTILTADLVIAVLNGQIRDTAQAKAWLQSRSNQVEAPVSDGSPASVGQP